MGGNLRFFGPQRPKAEYMDERGQIDKRKLLEIATENATKLAIVIFLAFYFG